ncbi:hypothetical protein CVT24_012210 [Panaeolus cyanescens]|uniref:Uncharacterized protein n=1 Tax=Panaeolus cyanescens TaxID=181874 RepID=A0A409YIT2_9AGAR|nr:hypothetical protein CVT24_012210 [Panaeolus cyanescens]
MYRMPGLTISRSKAPLLNKIKVALSRTKGPKDASALPIPGQATSVNLPSGAGTEPCEPPHPVIALTSNFISPETPTELPPTSSAVITQPEAPLTINDLPPEILAEIFHTYMFYEDEPDLLDPELEGMVSVFLPNARSAPLLFCGVCGYWRDVAIATPALWSALAIQKSFHLDTVSSWLERSQGHPLSLFISLDWDSSRYAKEQLSGLLEMLYAAMPRWQKVSVHLPTANDLQEFLFTLIPREGESPAASLQHLHLSAGGSGPNLDSDSISRLSSFPHPSLRRLTWDNWFPPDFILVSTSLWANLQQMTFLRTTTAKLHTFLKACTNVRFVYIHFLQTIIRAHETITPTVAHSLQSLNIGCVIGDLTEAIALLSAPNLKRLTYSHSFGSRQSKGLQEFLERSGCKLESLCIVSRTPEFDEAETKFMLHTPIFTAIPHFSLRLIEDGCHSSFPRAIIAETAEQWSSTAYVHYEPKNCSYHLGWGTLDIAYTFDIDYPFLVKNSKPIRKWSVALTDGPVTSA